MRGILIPILVAFCLLPTVNARPWILGEEVGVAEQGSREEFTPLFVGEICSEDEPPVQLTLALVAGAPTDALRLTFEDGAFGPYPTAVATLGHPAVIRSSFRNGCLETPFLVEGTAVAIKATYVLEVCLLDSNPTGVTPGCVLQPIAH